MKEDVYAERIDFDFPFCPFMAVAEFGSKMGSGDPYLAFRACCLARGFGLDDGPDMMQSSGWMDE